MVRSLIALSVVASVGLVVADGQSRASWTEGDTAWVSSQMTSSRNALKAPGLAVGVGLGHRVVFAGGVGSTDPGGRSAVTAATRFRVASVTKPVTATSVLRLVEEGRMELDAPVRTYCEGYPEQPKGNPTVRQVLAHQSGITHPTDADDTTITGDFPRLSESVRYYAGRPLAFPPGTDTLYSSWGYALLGCAIEGAAGRAYWEVASEVLRRAGATGAARDTPSFAAPDFSPGYRPGMLYGVRRSVIVDTRFKTPASGLIISTQDLLRFALALTDDTLLSESSRTAMFRPQPPAGKAATYALGWQIASPAAGAPAVAHSGSMEGVTALVYLVPSRGDAVVVISNLERSVPAVVPLVRAIAERLAAKR
jgi:CubicO group peptidase (beta-lactamase class C family)